MTIKLRLFCTGIAVVLCTGSACLAVSTFRGVPLNQGGNLHSSDVLGPSQPWFIDVQDSFQRDGSLVGSTADGWNLGFVPPRADSPLGPLAGHPHGDLVGRWMGASDYVTREGRVFRQEGTGVAVACVPWRVTPELGNNYLLEMDAHIAPGESVRLGYFGDASGGPESGLIDSPIGQLVLDISRGSDDLWQWTVKWQDGAGRSFLGNNLPPIADSEELTMQLGWNDVQNTFEAWIRAGDASHLLARGGMSEPIDVFGAGFEMTGGASSAANFLAAVPEPATAWLLLGSLALLGFRHRATESRTTR